LAWPSLRLLQQRVAPLRNLIARNRGLFTRKRAEA